MKIIRKTEIETDHYKVGDVISLEPITGDKFEALAVRQEPDGLIFILKDCSVKEYSEYLHEGLTSYKDSNLRKILNNEILNSFPSSVYSKLMSCNCWGDLIRLPMSKEIFGSSCWGLMKDTRNRIALHINKATHTYHGGEYWLDDTENLFQSYYRQEPLKIVDGSGDWGWKNFSAGIYVRPVFKLRNLKMKPNKR